MPKLTVGVIFGGRSREHEVSIQSARAVCEHLAKARFNIKKIHVPKTGELDVQALKNDIDVAFLVMHGSYGEDGCLQGALEIADIPYIGPGVLSSAVMMDKIVAKILVKAAGIPTANWMVLEASCQGELAAHYQTARQKLGEQLFIKPANTGSSVGVFCVDSESAFIDAVNTGLLLDDRVIVEEKIVGQEIECAIIESTVWGEPPRASAVGEIKPNAQAGFYSYEAKYLDGNMANLLIPADLSPQQTEQARQVAQQAFTALCGEGMARIDLFLEDTSGRILFNEANSLPGFTSISMYPKLWQASGISYGDLLTLLIELGLARARRKHQKVTDFNNLNP